MKFDWKLADEIVASWQRPYATYICSTAIAIACLFHDSAAIAIPVAGAVVGGNIAARTIDKKTAAAASGKPCPEDDPKP